MQIVDIVFHVSNKYKFSFTAAVLPSVFVFWHFNIVCSNSKTGVNALLKSQNVCIKFTENTDEKDKDSKWMRDVNLYLKNRFKVVINI